MDTRKMVFNGTLEREFERVGELDLGVVAMVVLGGGAV
jgi:hypothetical protein